MKKQVVSEFRKDLVSGEWILVVSGRKMRPQLFKKTVKICPFESIFKNLPKDKFVTVIPNKYPILDSFNVCPQEFTSGPYQRMENAGFHEVIITRDHKRTLKDMTIPEIEEVVRTYQERYRFLGQKSCIKYILVFHNQGELAGASIPHPHSQLVALPIIPPDVSRSVEGSKRFFKSRKKCVHCIAIEWEKKNKKRIIFENKHFIAFVPYASRVSYEVRIFPKRHEPHFEKMSALKRPFFARALKDSLKKIAKALGSPDYNFFIHTSPVGHEDHYHWHIEILPRSFKWAGVELGTGIEVVGVPPEEAAGLLRRA